MDLSYGTNAVLGSTTMRTGSLDYYGRKCGVGIVFKIKGRGRTEIRREII